MHLSGARTIVIVGGGFCGTLTAVHLLRRGVAGGVHVVLVERGAAAGLGVAYGTPAVEHLLNVPAARMSALPEDEESFLRFARERDPAVEPGAFLPRRRYGEYLGALLDDAVARAASGTSFERITDEAVGLRPAEDGVSVALGGGGLLRADRVVLALGNAAPADPWLADRRFYASSRYVRDPWAPGALERVPLDRPVLLLGTGLTMIDVALRLRTLGHAAPLHAVSRRGLLPQAHRSPSAPPAYDHLPPDLVAEPPTARGYLRAVRAHVATLAARGLDWREVVNSLRPITPALWHRLPATERARFLRHVRPYWEVHRHRMAPRIAAAVETLRAEGTLGVAAGRVVEYAEDETTVRATIHPRRGAAPVTLEVGAVVNCTGPESDVRRIADPLVVSLRAQGLLRADPHGQGLDLAADGALLDGTGSRVPSLSYVGPLLKSRHWESTAVPELRVHAAQVARAVATSLEVEVALGV